MNDAKPPSNSTLIADLDNGVLWLRLNRPEAMNALDRSLGYALIAAIEGARHDERVRAVVLTGNGRAFCAGDDIGGVKAYLLGDHGNDKAPSDAHDRTALYLRLCMSMLHCPKPIVAAINGAAFGAGTEILCAADVRCMARSARIGSGLVKIGAVGNAAFLGSAVGAARAFEIYVTGRAVDAAEALSIGLAHYVYDDDCFAESVARLARQLAMMPTKVIGFQKRLRNDCAGRSPLEQALIQDEAHRACFASAADAREGATAFIEKRSPQFMGT